MNLWTKRCRTIYLGTPHLWFAWHPVWVTQGHLVWLETVQRTIWRDEKGKYLVEHQLWKR